MVQPTTPSPLVIIPHSDFERQASGRLHDALASGFIKEDTYGELCIDLQWALPFQHEQMIVHINDQIKNATPTLIPNSNVRLSAAPFSTELRLPRLSTSPTTPNYTPPIIGETTRSTHQHQSQRPAHVSPHTFTPPTWIETPI